MKKQFLFLLFVVFCFAGTAQNINATAEAQSEFPNANLGTIVRPLNGHEVVSYLFENGKGYFCITDVTPMLVSSSPTTLSAQKIPIPFDCSVYDVRTLQDKIYFCGHKIHNGSYCGFYGYVSLVNYQFYYVHVTETSALTKLTVYLDSGQNIRLAAIGRNVANPSWHPDVIVYADNPTSGTHQYHLIQTQGEYVHDVLLTPHYVVFVGKQGTPATEPLWIRRANRDSFMDGTLNTKYSYLYPAQEINHATYATYIIGTPAIAVAYIHYYGSSGNNYSTRVHTINADSDMQMVASQEYLIEEKYEPTEMTFVRPAEGLVLLHNCRYDATTTSKFFVLDPFAHANYLSYFLAHPENDFTSIHRFGTHFISTGKYFWLVQNPTMSMIMSQTYCPKAYKFDAYVLPVAERAVEIESLRSFERNISTEDSLSFRTTFYPFVDCIRSATK